MKRGFKYVLIFGLILSVFLIQFSNNPVKAFPTTNNNWIYSTGVEISYTAFSENGQYIAAASNKMLYLFHRSSPIPLWNYTTGDDIYSVELSADGQYIVAGIGSTTYLFNRSSSTPLWANETGSVAGANAAISADGQYIIAGDFGNPIIYFFHRDSSTALWTCDLNSIGLGGAAASLAISAHGEICVVGTGGIIYTFDTFGTNLAMITDPTTIKDVAVSEDGVWVIAGDNSGSVFIFNYYGAQMAVLIMGTEIISVDASNNIGKFGGPYFVAGDITGNFSFCQRTNFDTVDVMWSCILPAAMTPVVGNVAISADGQYIAATVLGVIYTPQVFTFQTNIVSYFNVTSLWNYTLTTRAPPHDSHSHGLAMSADGRYVATGTVDGNLYFFDHVDSDGDDLADGYEEDTSPTDPYLSDSDGDGLNDSAELFLYPTNATDPDTDDDGLTDGEEILTYFTNATNPDTDGDGYSDGAEVAAGSDPLDPASVPSEGIPGFELAFALLAGVIILFQNRFHKKPKPFAGSEFFEKEFYSDCFQRAFQIF